MSVKKTFYLHFFTIIFLINFNSFKYFDDKIVKIIYPTFIRPHIKFAIQIWNPQTKTEINKLERLLKKAIDLATNLKRMNYELLA